MKTMKRVIRENPSMKKLIRSVCRDCDPENFTDVINHGANCGFGNFIYYDDTVKFTKNNKQDIDTLLLSYKEEFGENTIFSMMKNWSCLRDYTESEIIAGYYGEDKEMRVQVYNALAWFALEEVARLFED